jgi:hypothetical protein
MVFNGVHVGSGEVVFLEKGGKSLEVEFGDKDGDVKGRGDLGLGWVA